MQSVTAISATTVSQNSVQVRGDAEQNNEKSFEAVLRDAEASENADAHAPASSSGREEPPADGVLRGRQTLRERVRKAPEAGEVAETPVDPTQSVQALLSGLLGGTEVVSEAGPIVPEEGGSLLDVAVGLVGEITKPAAGAGVAQPAVATPETTPLEATAKLTDGAEQNTPPAGLSAADAVVVANLARSSGVVPDEGRGSSTQQSAEIAAVPLTSVAPSAAAERTNADTHSDTPAGDAVLPDSTYPQSADVSQSRSSTPVTQSAVSSAGGVLQRNAPDGSMIDAAKAAWQGLEMQRVGRNVAASVQTAHGEISVVAQVAHGETHMLAELPSTLVRAMSAQVQGELRRELHDNGILAGEMEFREGDQEPYEQRQRSNQREEADNDWNQ